MITINPFSNFPVLEMDQFVNSMMKLMGFRTDKSTEMENKEDKPLDRLWKRYSPYVNTPPPPSRANLEPVGFIISTFRSNLGGGGFYYFNFWDPQNDRFLAFL